MTVEVLEIKTRLHAAFSLKLRSKKDGRNRSESGSVGNLQVCQVRNNL